MISECAPNLAGSLFHSVLVLDCFHLERNRETSFKSDQSAWAVLGGGRREVSVT